MRSDEVKYGLLHCRARISLNPGPNKRISFAKRVPIMDDPRGLISLAFSDAPHAYSVDDDFVGWCNELTIPGKISVLL